MNDDFLENYNANTAESSESDYSSMTEEEFEAALNKLRDADDDFKSQNAENQEDTSVASFETASNITADNEAESLVACASLGSSFASILESNVLPEDYQDTLEDNSEKIIAFDTPATPLDAALKTQPTEEDSLFANDILPIEEEIKVNDSPSLTEDFKAYDTPSVEEEINAYIPPVAEEVTSVEQLAKEVADFAPATKASAVKRQVANDFAPKAEAFDAEPDFKSVSPATKIRTVLVEEPVNSQPIKEIETKQAPKIAKTPEKKKGEVKVRTMLNSADCGFKLASGEQILKSYDCTKSGRLTITNKRVLYADLLKTRKEVPLENVTAVESSYKMCFSALLFVIACALIGGCIALFVVDFVSLIANCPAWVKFVFWGVGACFGIGAIICLCFVLRLKFAFSIHCTLSEKFVSIKVGNRISNDATIIDRPGKEARKMMKEIGAVILNAKAEK